jgi:hypothetical protein
VALAVLGEQLGYSTVEASPVHNQLASHGMRLDLQAIHERPLVTAAVDGGKHRIDMESCMNAQWTHGS